MRRVNKKILQGDEQLFLKYDWISADKLFGENRVLTSPLMHSAFDLILEKHTPTHKTAFLSLCTSTRPFLLSKKWKKFISEFKNKADLIVVSSGGFVPQNFWCSYPFLNYDAPEHQDDNLYKEVMYDRMMRFFKTHRYDYVLANFSPKQRNRETAEQGLSKLKADGFISDFNLIPNVETYNEAQKQGWKENGKMFPDLNPVIFKELKLHIEKAQMRK